MMRVLLAAGLLCFASIAHADRLSYQEINIKSRDATLSATLVLPSSQPIEAAIMFVHGSGKQTRNLNLAKEFAHQGIAALVYDKRGVGKSGGDYESQQSVSGPNIELLADDASAALKALTQHQQLIDVPIGISGISQAGWIAPLAAKNSTETGTRLDFVVLWSAPVCKVSEEDIYSKHTNDIDSENVPSYSHALTSRKQPYHWPAFLGRDTSPAEDLAGLSIPGLWIFGENDGSIPVDLSIQRLKNLKAMGHNYNHVLFSGLGHNNVEQTFNTATQWIKRVSRSISRRKHGTESK